jgi:arylsulfatase A-like enzyme
VAIYGAIGFVFMAAVGVIAIAIIRVGRYEMETKRLAGIFVALFIALMVYMLLYIEDSAFDVIERGLVAAGTGLAAGIITLYILKKVRNITTLAVLCISSVIWVSILSYGVLWLNASLHPGKPWTTSNLLLDFALLIVTGFFILVTYRLSLYIGRRTNQQIMKKAGWLFVGIAAISCVVVSSIGPFSFEESSEDKSESYVMDEVELLANSTAPGDSPNIIWIVIDTVRVDHLSCYGYERNTTPNLDIIASEGILFDNAISAAPWTIPSHASMFTSTYTCEHNMHGSRPWLDDNFVTIAEVLSAYGYETYGFSNNALVAPRYNFNQGFKVFEATWGGKKKIELELQLVDQLRARRYLRRLFRSGEQTTAVGEKVYDVIEDKGAKRTNETVKSWISDVSEQEKPFFVFINYMEAHSPYQPPESFAVEYLPDNVDMNTALRLRYKEAQFMTGVMQYDETDFDIFRALYDGEISYLDFRIGELIDYLRETEILDNTILIINSDHGENFGEHGLMNHQFCVYDTLIHVPLIIRYPSAFEAGSRVTEVVETVDIFPTILDIVGIDGYNKAQIRGHSLTEEREQSLPGYAISEHRVWLSALERIRDANYQFDTSVFARDLEAIRTDEFKYIWSPCGKEELYNIRQDPQELDNLIESKPEVANELRSLLWQTLSSCESCLPATMQE